MSRISQGYDMREPVLQPNTSRFQQTSSGFDIGSRQFLIDSRYFESHRPDKHQADTKLSWRDATGDLVTGTYARMFVDTVDIVEEKNGLTRYTVSYLGMIGKHKPGDLVDNTELGRYRTTAKRALNLADSTLRSRITAFEHTPTVTHTYLSVRAPRREEVGARISPPSTGAVTKQLKPAMFFVKARGDDDIIFEGWVLRSRGSRRSGTVYEIRDVHSYERIREDSAED